MEERKTFSLLDEGEDNREMCRNCGYMQKKKGMDIVVNCMYEVVEVGRFEPTSSHVNNTCHGWISKKDYEIANSKAW